MWLLAGIHQRSLHQNCLHHHETQLLLHDELMDLMDLNYNECFDPITL